MDVTDDDNTENKKSRKKLKKGKERSDNADPKKKEQRKDLSKVIAESPADKLPEDEELKKVHKKAKKEKKKKSGPADVAVEVESTTVQEIKVPEGQEEVSKKKRKRKVDTEDDGAPSPQPKKKSKKARAVEETEVKEEQPQVENTKTKKSRKPASEKVEVSEKPKKKRKNKTGFPNPAEDDDENLSDQAKKALIYAFTQFHDPKRWKFNKARQNWLVRNYWSVKTIPEKYEELVIKYLSAVQGNARENLIQTCQTVIKEADTVKEEEKPADQKGAVGGALIDTPSAPESSQVNVDQKKTRARALLQALVQDDNP